MTGPGTHVPGPTAPTNNRVRADRYTTLKTVTMPFMACGTRVSASMKAPARLRKIVPPGSERERGRFVLADTGSG